MQGEESSHGPWYLAWRATVRVKETRKKIGSVDWRLPEGQRVFWVGVVERMIWKVRTWWLENGMETW